MEQREPESSPSSGYSTDSEATPAAPAAPAKKYVTPQKTSNKLHKIIDALVVDARELDAPKEADIPSNRIREVVVGDRSNTSRYIGEDKTRTALTSDEKNKFQLKYNWYYNYFLRYGSNLLKNPNSWALLALISIGLLFIGGPIVAPLFAAIASISAVVGAFVALPHFFKATFTYFEKTTRPKESAFMHILFRFLAYPLILAFKNKGQAFIVGLGASAFITILVMTALYMASGGVSCEFMGAIIEPLISVLKNAFELLGNFLGLDIIGNISLPALAAAIVVIAPLTVTATARLSVDAYNKHITLVDADDADAAKSSATSYSPSASSKSAGVEVGCGEVFIAWHEKNMTQLSAWHQSNVDEFNGWWNKPGCYAKMFGENREEDTVSEEGEQAGCFGGLFGDSKGEGNRIGNY